MRLSPKRAALVALAGAPATSEYVSRDVSAAVSEIRDYEFFETATGKAKADLGG